MTSIDEYPKPTLLTLGGSALAAVAVGLCYGRNKRVWCRYLCLVSGVFGLLAKVAPLHFAVERERRALLNINLSFDHLGCDLPRSGDDPTVPPHAQSTKIS